MNEEVMFCENSKKSGGSSVGGGWSSLGGRVCVSEEMKFL